MKVLFAVSNENISTQIVKRYQKEYKEIISYKNMYYFNAIVKELQRDKSYDRIVISEDLEPFANNNFDAIEKFIFEKLDNISDEATGINGKDIPIILLATDRRRKSESILVKLFGIGIYNILLGQDRTTDNVCSLLNKPRSKKEAKQYYKIESDEVSYKSESEENVSESEIKNILNHYRRLGKDEDRYVESFNNIAAQYNDAQLRIITKFLPLNVKAVLEEQSPKYQSVMSFTEAPTSELMKKKKEEEGLKVGFLNYSNANKPTRPVIVPTAVKKIATKKNIENRNILENKIEEVENNIEPETLPGFEMLEENNDLISGLENIIEEPELNNVETQEIVEPIKKGRGRPRKISSDADKPKANVVKRGRGRPRKVTEPTNEILPESDEIEKSDAILPGFDEFEELNSNEFKNIEKSTLLDLEDENEDILPGFDDIDENNDMLPGFDNVEEKEDILPGFDDVEEKEDILPGFDDVEEEDEMLPGSEVSNDTTTSYSSNNNVSDLLLKDKKVISFVGTTKNGTSFLVNNLAKSLASMGIKTAILDLTTNRNSYYIYTKNEEKLRNIAYESIKKLNEGIISGIAVNQYLDVFTALPGDELPLDNSNEIISTLVKNYSVVLMDCDFNTPVDYFKISQEFYIVQTMDILTIQPMTAFLRDLKAKEVLNPEKVRVIINKMMNVRGLNVKAIIGGLAFYNDPSMSFMTELFDKDTVKYYTVPFDEDVCSKYLEGVMECEIRINSYPKRFNERLKELANMVYPLLGNKKKRKETYTTYNNFSQDMNNTLEQMKNRY